MSYIYKGAEGWVKQPNRMVKTFRSGLCMIQQDYIQRKDKVDFFSFREGDRLSDEDSEPCIDGAFIFPAPEYKDMVRGIIGFTTGTSKSDGYTEDGSIQSARTMEATKRNIDYAEAGVRLRKDIGKFAISGELITSTNGYKTVDASVIYNVAKGQTISVSAVRQDKDQIATNAISVRAKMNF